MEVAEVGIETAAVVVKNENAIQDVKVEDAPESGDAEVVATIRLVKKPAAKVEEKEEEAEEEEEVVIVVVEGDENGETVEVTETEQVVLDTDADTAKTTTTVKVIKQQVEPSDANVEGGSGSDTTATTTTVIKKAVTVGAPTQSEVITTTTTTVTTAKGQDASNETNNDGETNTTNTTTKVTKTVVTTVTPPTPTTESTKTVVKEVPQNEKVATKEEEKKENVAAESADEEVEEEEEEEEDEDEEDDAEEDEKPQEATIKTTNVASKPLQATPVSIQAPAAAPAQTTQQNVAQQQKQDNLNNTLKEIISDIDRDIEQQEDIAKLKAQQQELLKQQQLLAQQIRQQQLLAQQLAAQNQLQEQHLQNQKQQQQQQQQQPQPQPQQYHLPSSSVSQNTDLGGHVSKSTTVEESQNENGYTRTNKSYEVEESSNITKRIDLQKIFTPATDSEEILPKNRKLYASSAFYSPTLHPTVEDQVELARRISHSLSDISNQQSKGQSMYVNRKKRSVKWVHEGSGKIDSTAHEIEYEEESKENTNDGTAGQQPLSKVPLKLVMNPRGQIRDFNSVRETLNTETGLLSPDKCAEVVTALNAQKGKGAELFAKRRRKADKWVVDETNAGTQSPSGLPDYHQYQAKPPTSPSLLPAYSDAGKHRVQLNMQQEQLLEKYAKPGLKVVKTPWEAALETGSASSAFVEEHKLTPYSNQPTPTLSPAPAPQYFDQRGPSPYSGASVVDNAGYDYNQQQPQHKLPQVTYQTAKPSSYNSQRDLAYKPSIAQGWKAPSMTLPKDLGYDLMLPGLPEEEQRQQQQQHEQQLQQHIFSAAKHCEALTNKDDDELISYMECMQKQQQTQKQQQQHHTKTITATANTTTTKSNIVEEHQHRIVDVAKQLQQFEEYQQLIAMQQRQEEQLMQLRLQRQLESKYQREQQQRKFQENARATDESMEKQKQQQQREQEEERDQQYVKVAVRDLISTFEQQTLAEAEEIAKQQQMLLQWKERQQKSMQQQQRQQYITKQTKHISFEDYQRGKELQLQQQQYDEQQQRFINDKLDVDNSNSNSNGNSNGNNNEKLLTTTTSEKLQELYVPKEIPLESYAPPPTAPSTLSSKPSHSWSPTSAPYSSAPSSTLPPQDGPSSQQQYPIYSSYQSAQEQQHQPQSFPTSKPNLSGFGSYGQTATYAPPKQQILPPTSYQTVPQTSNQAPQVNFNPSPLPYDKLAKFDNPSPPEIGSPGGNAYNPYRPLGVPGAGSRVRNVSPTPYGGIGRPASAASQSYPPVLSPQINAGGATSPIYGTPGSSRPPSQQFGSYGGTVAPSPVTHAVDLSHCQNFNNAARGWGAGQRSGGGIPVGYRNTKPLTTTGSLPYTDF